MQVQRWIPGIKTAIPPLHESVIFRSNSQIAQLLLDAGAEVDPRNAEGKTPLQLAVKYCSNFQIPQLLIHAGADVTVMDEHNNTLLHWALRWFEHPDLVSILIDAGLGVNALNEKGETPLHKAVEQRMIPEIVASLIRAGADVNLPENNGMTPLHYAIRNGESRKNQFHTDLNLSPAETEASPILQLFSEKDYTPKVLQALLDAGADINACDHRGNRPFDYISDSSPLKGTKVYWQIKGRGARRRL